MGSYGYYQAPQVALVVKNLPVNAGDIETLVQSLGQEDPLEEGMATHSRILAWRIPWTEEPGGLQKEILMMGYINMCSVDSIAAI